MSESDAARDYVNGTNRSGATPWPNSVNRLRAVGTLVGVLHDNLASWQSYSSQNLGDFYDALDAVAELLSVSDAR